MEGSSSSCDEPSNAEILQKEIDYLKEKLRTKINEVNQLSETYQSQLKQFVHTIEKTAFPYKCLKKSPKWFFYTVEPLYEYARSSLSSRFFANLRFFIKIFVFRIEMV